MAVGGGTGGGGLEFVPGRTFGRSQPGVALRGLA